MSVQARPRRQACSEHTQRQGRRVEATVPKEGSLSTWGRQDVVPRRKGRGQGVGAPSRGVGSERPPGCQGGGGGAGGPVTPSSQGPGVALSVGPARPSPSFLVMMEQIRAKYKQNLKLSCLVSQLQSECEF